MVDDVVIEPMSKDFVVWRCLHGGPLSREGIDSWPAETKIPWDRYRSRNRPLLLKLTEVYGACAIVGWEGETVAAQLRFYPRAVWKADGAGLLCLQQDHPAVRGEGWRGARYSHQVPLRELREGPQRRRASGTGADY